MTLPTIRNNVVKFIANVCNSVFFWEPLVERHHTSIHILVRISSDTAGLLLNKLMNNCERQSSVFHLTNNRLLAFMEITETN